ncbi:MAG: amidophosphoribosyltransferase [Candidatus Omnitrophota bacterium]
MGLHSLQHRGEESCGIAVSDTRRIRQITGMGLVAEVLDKKKLKGLKGRTAIGHVRYSTTGSSAIRNAQPFGINHHKACVSIAHNGNLTNAVRLRRQLEKKGAIFQTTMDSEVILHLLVRSSKEAFEEKLGEILPACKGAYSLIFLALDKLIGARDPYGFRPLCLGKKDDSYVLASETCAFDLIEAEYIRDIEPGEIVVISKKGVESYKPFKEEIISQCIFEFIYFARPDSCMFGESIYQVRKRLGRKLAREHPVSADMVISIPDSGNYAALGYSEQSKTPFEFGITRNHYIGRTFIQPSQEMREHGVKVKLNPIKSALKGKRVVVVEDSIVRGTTTSGRIKAIREAGAKEIHMRISCPPIMFPCFYGIDFPSKDELIANKLTVEEIGKYIGVDSLKYLSLEGMMDAVKGSTGKFCTACFTGKYPLRK